MKNGSPVKNVTECTYPETIFDDHLRFSSYTEVILKKCNKMIHHLRKLIFISSKILLTFFYTFIESVLLCSMIPLLPPAGGFQAKWTFHSLSEQQVCNMAAQNTKDPSHEVALGVTPGSEVERSCRVEERAKSGQQRAPPNMRRDVGQL